MVWPILTPQDLAALPEPFSSDRVAVVMVQLIDGAEQDYFS